jgi:hypothetical protein
MHAPPTPAPPRSGGAAAGRHMHGPGTQPAQAPEQQPGPWRGRPQAAAGHCRPRRHQARLWQRPQRPQRPARRAAATCGAMHCSGGALPLIALARLQGLGLCCSGRACIMVHGVALPGALLGQVVRHCQAGALRVWLTPSLAPSWLRKAQRCCQQRAACQAATECIAPAAAATLCSRIPCDVVSIWMACM